MKKIADEPQHQEVKQMRTGIFSSFADLPQAFRDDLDLLWKLSQDQRTSLISHVVKIYKATTVGEQKQAMDEAVTEVEGETAKTLRVLKLLLFIYRSWNPVRDAPEAFIKDLGDLGLLPEENVADATSFLVEFLAKIQEDNKRRLEKIFAGSILSNFLGCETLVDMRAVIDRPFGSDLESKIGAYEPTCVSFVPVVIVKIRHGEDTPDLNFQCEEHELKKLINSLEAALKDLHAARKSLPGE